MCDNDKRVYSLSKGNGSWILPRISGAPSVQIDSHMSSISLCFHKTGTDRTELINPFVVVCNGSQNKTSLISFSFMYIPNMGLHYSCQPQMNAHFVRTSVAIFYNLLFNEFCKDHIFLFSEAYWDSFLHLFLILLFGNPFQSTTFY